jgi:hypothetical protein
MQALEKNDPVEVILRVCFGRTLTPRISEGLNR